jgi:hypothetical protein
MRGKKMREKGDEGKENKRKTRKRDNTAGLAIPHLGVTPVGFRTVAWCSCHPASAPNQTKK